MKTPRPERLLDTSEKSLSLIVVEDNPRDAELLVRALTRAGYNPTYTRVDTETGYLAALDTPADLILADYSMPHFSGPRALALLRQRNLDVPFILISGTIGEEQAVAAIQQGVDDYLLKDRLARLGPAVAAALERRRLRAARMLAEARFRATFEQAAVGIVHTALDRRYLEVNRKFCDIVGYTRDELMSMRSSDIRHPDDAGKNADFLQRLLAGEIDTYQGERRYIRKDGAVIWVSRTISLVRDGAGQPLYFICVIEDIGERKLQEQRIRRLSRIHAVLSGINSLIVRVRDRDKLFRGACEIAAKAGNFGIAWIGKVDPQTQAVVPVAWAGVDCGHIDASDRSAHVAGNGTVGRAIREKQAVFSNDLRLDSRAGGARRRHAVELGYRSMISLPLLAEDRVVATLTLCNKEAEFFNAGELKLLDELADDISFALDYIDKMEKLDHLAYYDALTGLPNRMLMQDRLKQTLMQARRNRWITAVLLADLDGFKVVNDSLGHHAGDKLLRQAAGRLGACLRSSDTLARFSGDEFAITLQDIAAGEDASLVAQKILHAFATPFEIDGNETYVTISIGIALYPADGDDADTLIKNADTALHYAKDAGRNTFHFFTERMNRSTLARVQLETRLRRALDRNEFLLYFQPKVDAARREIRGFEALLRWQPPDAGLVSPAEFIPLLEETGLIVPVGEWVLRTACAQIAAWRHAGIDPAPVAINLSGRQFQQPGLDTLVRATLEEYAVDPRWLEVEITESMLMRKPEEAVVTIRNLKQLGIRIAVDDFGTGYSSLSYLKRFPLDALKIDRSFVRDISTDPDDAAITHAIVTMAHALNLKVIAEGVETAEQLAFLRGIRCDEVQGFLFSRPLAAADCTALLVDARRLLAPRAAPPDV